jgi:hypothetical protein
LQKLIKLDILFVGGGTRNSLHSMEGIELNVDKADTNVLHYLFSVINWKDSFPDLEGSVKLDSSTFYDNNYFIKSSNKEFLPAYKYIDKNQNRWIGIDKTLRYARLLQFKNKDTIELNSGTLYAK